MNGYTDVFPKLGCNIGYDSSWAVNEVVILPVADELTFQGKPIWIRGAKPDPNLFLLELDPNPFECVGNWYFREIGISTTGFHDDDPPQQSIHAWPIAGRDELLTEMEATAADTRRYRPR